LAQHKSSGETLLSVSNLTASYGAKTVLHDVSISVGAGEIVGLFGHNGAGKTTLIRSVLGLVPGVKADIQYDGKSMATVGTRDRVHSGMALIPSERFVFPDLSIQDNLLLGASIASKETDRNERFELVHTLFPLLKDRAQQPAGTLSGGQQRMVSLGMALMSNPKLLLLDEPSLGLAPSIVDGIFAAVRGLVDQTGLSVLLLEQNVAKALTITDRVYVLRSGEMLVAETTEEMKNRENYWELF